MDLKVELLSNGIIYRPVLLSINLIIVSPFNFYPERKESIFISLSILF
jgi:hypothetical protein